MTSRGTVLITGASSGIGAELARIFDQEGFSTILTARRTERLEELAAELKGETRVIAGDLGSEAGIDALIDQLTDTPIDILVNNAGMMIEEDFTKLNREQVSATLTLNIMAPTYLTQALLPGMMQRKSGRILNVASLAGFHPVPSMDLYAATKAYVLSLTESLSENLRGTGVSITALCPGLTQTEMVDESLASTVPPFMMASAEGVAREGFDAVMNREPLRVPGPANKVALTWAQHQPRWLVRGLGGLAARLAPRK